MFSIIYSGVGVKTEFFATNYINRLSDRKKWIPPRLSTLGNTLGGYGDIFESRKSQIRIIPLKFRNKNKFEEGKNQGMPTLQ